MCGIFGGISVKQPQAVLKHMDEILTHRGPDESGSFIWENIALGHRRLSIIDLTSGQQPMFSLDKKQAIVYNGEIYNFKEIKEILIKKGHHFQTESDTEVIINAYREWGYDCLNRFNGMFAFALWDKDINKLWIARDRIGKKPLYYMNNNGAFYFASEAKALWSLSDFSNQYDFNAIDQYLTFRYVPSNRTFYKGITKLPPGHWMLIDKNAQISKLTQWWDIPRIRENIINRQDKLINYYEEFNSIFSSAVKLRLISDVPLGLFLSSGIDSSSIAFEMAKSSPPTCISIGFGEKTDELATTDILAKRLNAQYYPFIMKKDDFNLFEESVSSMDEPYGDPIILPTFLLAKRASERVKVILTGDGGDESLGGYIHHDYFRKMPTGIPQFVTKIMSLLVKIIPQSSLDLIFNYPASLGRSGKNRISHLFNIYPNTFQSYMSFAAIFQKEEKDQIYSDYIKKELDKSNDNFSNEMNSHFLKKGVSAFDKVMQWDLKTWFPYQTLMKLDRLSMAHSIEGRCPYADYRLIEFLLRIPLKIFKILSQNKQVIRKTYQGRAPFLPNKKQAFYLPMDNIFNKKANELIKDVLNKKNVEKTGIFEYSYIQTLFNNRKHSPLLTDKQIMCLVILLLWLKKQN